MFSVCAKELVAESEDPLPARAVPHSVVRLKLSHVTPGLVAGLLATRNTRDLQSVEFGLIGDAKTAALAAELVSTDPGKRWKFQGEFKKGAAAAFCSAAASVAARSSLVELKVNVDPRAHAPFAAMLSAVPTIESFTLLYMRVMPLE